MFFITYLFDGKANRGFEFTIMGLNSGPKSIKLKAEAIKSK
jgi:hypothetical protein